MVFFGLVSLPGTLPCFLYKNKGVKTLGQPRTSVSPLSNCHFTLCSPKLYTLLGLISAGAKVFTCLKLKDAFFCINLASQRQLGFTIQWQSPKLEKRDN
jgi:hypothetical protein